MRAFAETASARSTLVRPLVLLAGLVLAGCFLEPKEKSAGVDDFPNSIYARVDGFLDENKKAEGLKAPDTDSLLVRVAFDGPPVAKLAAGAKASLSALAKSGRTGSPAASRTEACMPTFTWSETKPPIGSRITVDTLVICVDANFLDTIKGNEHIVRAKSVTRDTVSGRVEINEVSDADGDGILNPIPGGQAKAKVNLLVAEKGGAGDRERVVMEETRMVIGDGPDDDFDTDKDNLVYELSWSRTAAGDTLASASFADADSDDVAMDNGKPSLVDITWYRKGPTEDNPDVVWSRLQMRTLAVHGVRKKEPKRFSLESETKDGRRNRAVILSLGGEADFDARDTVLARFHAVGTAAADSIDTMETAITMTLGDFDDKGDDTTYALRVQVRKKLGEEKSALFEFRPARPIPHGKEPEAGTLTMRVDYVDGTALDVAGVLTEKTLDVDARLRDGGRIRAVWDRSGKRISLERLE